MRVQPGTCLRRAVLTTLVASAALLTAACEDDPAGPDLTVPLLVTAEVGGTAIADVVVEVTAPDIDMPVAVNLTIQNDTARGTVEVRAGSDRTFTVRAFNAAGVETHTGSTTVDVVAGTNPAITIVIQPVVGDQPVVIVVGSIAVAVEPGTGTLAVGDTVWLRAIVTDASGAVLDVPVTWATTNTARATVDTAGLVTAMGPGEVDIVASYAGVAAVAHLSIGPGWDALVSDMAAGSIVRISSLGDTATFRAGLTQPRGLAIEADGSVVVAEAGGTLRRILPDGSGSSAVISGLGNAAGLAIADDGDLVVTQDVEDGRLLRIEPDGTNARVLVAGIQSEDVEVDDSGDFVLYDESTADLLRISPAGAVTVLGSMPGSVVAAVVIESGGSIIVTQENGTVQRVASDGSGQDTLASGLGRIGGVAIAPGGDLLVSAEEGTVTRLSPDGARSSVFAELTGTLDHIAVRLP